MKKIGLIVLMMGIAMNSYGMDLERERPADESRKPFSNKYIYPNSLDVENPYPECSQHIKVEKEQARLKGLKEGRQEEKLSTAEILLGMGLSDEQIMQVTRLTAEQLEEVKTKNRDG